MISNVIDVNNHDKPEEDHDMTNIDVNIMHDMNNNNNNINTIITTKRSKVLVVVIH